MVMYNVIKTINSKKHNALFAQNIKNIKRKFLLKMIRDYLISIIKFVAQNTYTRLNNILYFIWFNI